jgi:hypothetical protein
MRGIPCDEETKNRILEALLVEPLRFNVIVKKIGNRSTVSKYLKELVEPKKTVDEPNNPLVERVPEDKFNGKPMYKIIDSELAKVTEMTSIYKARNRLEQQVKALLDNANTKEIEELSHFILAIPPYNLLTVPFEVFSSGGGGKVSTRIMPIVKTKYILGKLTNEKAPKEVLALGQKIVDEKSNIFENLEFYYYPFDLSLAGFWYATDFKRKEATLQTYFDLIRKKDEQYSKIVEKRFKELLGAEINLP